MNLYKALICLGFAAPVFAQYSGPAILSRGEAPAAMAQPQVDFRPFLTVTGTYDTGLSGVSVNSQGQLASSGSIGMQFAGGVSGVHSWKHTKLGLDYTGALNHYFKTTYYDATTQTLALGLTHQLSRHMSFNLRESAGIFSQNFTSLGLPQTVPFDSSQSSIPVTDFFDNRTIYLTTQADLVIQQNARTSFDFGASAFINRRRSTALYGVTGYNAHADVQHRVTRHTTIGAQYTYTHFEYTHIFSSTDVHGAAISFSTRMTRFWEFTGFGGFSRVESKILQQVTLDPVVAALLGVSTGESVAYYNEYIPTFSARLSRTFHTGVFYVTGSRSVVPGNGLFLTTTMNNVASGYTYTGRRHWSFTTQVLYDRGKSIGNIVGTYGDISGGLSVSRDIVKSLHLVAGFDGRAYQSPSFNQYNRVVWDAHLGVGFTPGDVPLRLW